MTKVETVTTWRWIRSCSIAVHHL